MAPASTLITNTPNTKTAARSTMTIIHSSPKRKTARIVFDASTQTVSAIRNAFVFDLVINDDIRSTQLTWRIS